MGYSYVREQHSYVREQYTQQNLCVGVLSFYIINIPCYIRSNEEGIESVAQKNGTGYQMLSGHVCPRGYKGHQDTHLV